jgi:hypothetical protein
LWAGVAEEPTKGTADTCLVRTPAKGKSGLLQKARLYAKETVRFFSETLQTHRSWD